MSKKVKITCPVCENETDIRLVYNGVVIEDYRIILDDNGSLKLSEEPKNHSTEATGCDGGIPSVSIRCANCGSEFMEDTGVFSGSLPERLSEGVKEWARNLPKDKEKEILKVLDK